MKNWISIKRKVRSLIFKRDTSWKPNEDDFASTERHALLNFNPVKMADEIISGAPIDYAKNPIVYSDFFKKSHKDLGVYILPNAKVFFDSGLIEIQEGGFLKNTSWYDEDISTRKYPVFFKKCQVEKLSGKCLSLATEFAANNYGHFLLDGIGRLSLFTKWDKSVVSTVDWVIVSGEKKPWKIRLLSKFNIPERKIVWASGNSSFECDVLYVSSFPGVRRIYPHWLCDFLQKSIKCVIPSSKMCNKKRLFISRKGTSRNITNESELLEAAKKYGFQEFFPESSPDPIIDFSNAEAVIGAHGAGLTDIVFMDPGAKVLELMPTDHQFPYFYSLAVGANLNYEVLLGKSESHRDKTTFGPSPFDFTIDIDYFKKYLMDNFN